MMIIVVMMIASYTNYDDRIVHIMMIVIIILTASYIRDDVRIVYALAIYDAIFFGNERTNQPTNKAILGVRFVCTFLYFLHFLCSVGESAFIGATGNSYEVCILFAYLFVHIFCIFVLFLHFLYISIFFVQCW